jgi:hypothetical protein
MGCIMNFRRILVVLFVMNLAAVVNAVEPEKLFSSAEGKDTGSDAWKINGSSQGDNCYEPNIDVSPGSSSVYMFYEHILVFSNLEKSRCIILKDVPYSGYYDVKVVAMYTQGGGYYQDKEEYRLCIDLPDTTVVGPIIRDQNSDTLSGKPAKGPKDGYDYVENDHGFQYLIKGDNMIHFEVGDQFTGNGMNNSVDFASVSLLWLRPSIVAEPQFTPGSSNTISYRPIYDDIYTQDVICFDKAASTLRKPSAQLLRKALLDGIKTATFNGLEDGHTYGYYIETYITKDNLMLSNIIYSTQDATPPEQVKIEPMSSYANQRAELYWKGVHDTVSGDSLYKVVRYDSNGGAVKDTIVAAIPARVIGGGANYSYHYTDIIADTFYAQDYYQYRIDAMDSVGNWSSGVPTQLVVGIQAPKPTLIPEPPVDHFYKGPSITVAVNTPKLFPDSYFIRFQAARDSIKFFTDSLDNQWGIGKYFFDSRWLQIKDTSDVVKYVFDLTNSGKNTLTFIDGHRYYIRARFKDLQDNYSEWSSPDTMWVVPDCFAPEDVSFLSVVPTTFEDNTDGRMEITWGGAVDHTSGIESFFVYRKIGSLETTYKWIATVKLPEYHDLYDSIKFNGSVSYRIGSVDNVGNRRDSLSTKYTVTARSQAAPSFTFTAPNGYTDIQDVLFDCRLDNFEEQKNFKLIAMAKEKETEKEVELEATHVIKNIYNITLPETGTYYVRIKTLFNDKSSSIWSNPECIIYEKNPPSKDILKMSQVSEFEVQSFPNPFNMSTTITYNLTTGGHVLIDIYNVQGKKIRTLQAQHENQGTHSVTWEGENSEGAIVSSGIYYYSIRIESDDGQKHNIIHRMLLIK